MGLQRDLRPRTSETGGQEPDWGAESPRIQREGGIQTIEVPGERVGEEGT